MARHGPGRGYGPSAHIVLATDLARGYPDLAGDLRVRGAALEADGTAVYPFTGADEAAAAYECALGLLAHLTAELLEAIEAADVMRTTAARVDLAAAVALAESLRRRASGEA